MTKRLRYLLGALALSVAALFAVGPAAVVKAADVSLSSVISGGLYNATTTSNGFTTAADKTKLDSLGNTAVKLATAAALPAYTYSNGAGTITGTSNGALAAVDGVTPATGDRIYVQHGVNAFENGVYSLTNGTAGTPYVLTRATDFDSGAEFVGSKFLVSGGATYANQLYAYENPATPTLGTTKIWFIPQRRDVRCRQCFDINDDFTGTSGTGNVPSTTAAGQWFSSSISGTATVTSVTANGSNSIIGQFQTSVTTTNALGILDAGNAVFKTDTDTDLYIETRLSSIPTLSNGATNQILRAGLENPSAITSGGAILLYDQATSTNWACQTNDGTTSQIVTTGPAVAANTPYTLVIRKYAGEDIWHCIVNGTEIGTGNATNVPGPTLQMKPRILAFKSVNNAGALTALWDGYYLRATFPKGR